MGTPRAAKSGTRLVVASMTRMDPRMPKKAQKMGMTLPVSRGFVLRWPRKCATGDGSACHGGGGTRGLRR